MNSNQSVIQILDENTANKIAAGEVVERPSSVVKELVENALDAQADRISLELTNGGRKMIRVTDNGTGMSKHDASIAILRHATSKIRSADDLFAIRSLGFRGEALPSIASVSRMEIVTRRVGDDFGARVICVGGEVQEVSDIGAPIGTSITVTDLFGNVPARQKFLKKPQTELGHITEMVNRFIISHSHADITLSHNEKQLIRSAGTGKIHDAILTVFGRDAVEALMPIEGESGAYRVWGAVSRPSYSKPNRSGQLFYVNRRFVRSRYMIHALDDAYRNILPPGRFPLLACFIEVEPHLVDVNVHPTKIEVKFEREWEVHNLIASCIRDALSSSAVSPTGVESLPVGTPQAEIRRPHFSRSVDFDRQIAQASIPDLQTFRSALAVKINQGEESATNIDADDDDFLPKAAYTPESPAVKRQDLLADLTILAQARNMYIVAQNSLGILLLDQHIIHERILYDRLDKAASTGLEVQRLMMPFTLSLGRREALVLENKLEDLMSMGFEIESFGKETFIVRAIPAIIADKDYEGILKDMIDELTELTLAKRLMIHRDAILATTACKMSVKAGDRLSMDEMKRLIEDLRETSNPYLCPHGRPIVICISNRELDKMFGRI